MRMAVPVGSSEGVGVVVFAGTILAVGTGCFSSSYTGPFRLVAGAAVVVGTVEVSGAVAVTFAGVAVGFDVVDF
jgi:hypothetical protein